MRGARRPLLLLTLPLLLAAASPAYAHVEREPIFVAPQADTSIRPATGGDFVNPRSVGDPAKRPAAFRAYTRRAWRGTVTRAERRGVLSRYTRLSTGQQRSARRFVSRLQRTRQRGPGAAELGLTDAKLTSEDTHVVCRPDSMSRLRTSLSQQRLSKSATRDRAAKRRLTALHRSLRRQCKFDEIQPAVNAADNGDTVLVMPGFYTEPTARAAPHNDARCRELLDASGAPSFEYHARCPNDLSLIALIGRNLQDRCIRCNVQIHGTGARPQDVVIEGAEEASDPGVAEDLFEDGKGQVPTAKEVGVRVERGDGTVLRNFTVRNTSEHGVYSIETDGITFSELKLFYSHEYGHLSFVTDHNIVEKTEAAGSSDAGLYPGASPPTRPRLNTIVRDNYSHHNAIGLSGTMGSNIHLIRNRFTQNSTGVTLDSLTRAGHPGFPQNSSVFEDNEIYSNNFDTYSRDAWVRSSVPAPIGAGILFAGGNDNIVRNNRIYDNWKWGTGLIGVPDILSTDNPKLQDANLSTSHRNKYERNVMGIAPDGTEMPNGVDFFWDGLGTANCWGENQGPGPNGRVVLDPSTAPTCEDAPNLIQPSVTKEVNLLSCFFQRGNADAVACDFFKTPPRPGAR